MYNTFVDSDVFKDISQSNLARKLEVPLVTDFSNDTLGTWGVSHSISFYQCGCIRGEIRTSKLFCKSFVYSKEQFAILN